MVDRAVDRQPKGLKYDRWLVDRPVILARKLSPTASFLNPIKWGFLASFGQDFGDVFEPVFLISLRVFLHIFFGLKLPYQEESLKSVLSCVSKANSLSFHHKFYLVFSQKLELSIAIFIL